MINNTREDQFLVQYDCKVAIEGGAKAPKRLQDQLYLMLKSPHHLDLTTMFILTYL